MKIEMNQRSISGEWNKYLILKITKPTKPN